MKKNRTPEEIQAHYDECIANGCDHDFAVMLVEQKAPRIMTDAVAFGDISLQNDQWGEKTIHGKTMGQLHRDAARAAGVNPDGKKYMAGIATKPCDPRAWVSTRGEVKERCESLGLRTLDGMVKVDQPENDTDDPLDQVYQVSDKVVGKRLAEEVETNPALQNETKRRERFHELKDRMSGTQVPGEILPGIGAEVG